MSFFNNILKVVGPLLPDSAVARGAQEYFNRRHSALGTMTSLEIDTTKRRVTLDLELKGELQPLHLVIERYELTTEGGKTFIEFQDVIASREWITALARDFLRGKKIEVPEFLNGVL